MTNTTQPKIGAQLFTIKEFTQTLPDIERSLRKIREIGFTEIQISKFGPVDEKEVAKIVEDNGLTVAATHYTWDEFQNDTDRLIDIHHLWKCRHPALGSLPKDQDYYTLEGIDRFVRELEPVAEKLIAAGLDFSYHNHSHEFVRFNGKSWFQHFYEAAPPEMLKAEIDVYWVTAGGGDPAAWIRKLGPRQPVIHVKDMAVLPDKTQRFAEVGEGNLNWPAILDACREVGVESCLIEQDNCYGADPFECLATSYRNLKAMGLS